MCSKNFHTVNEPPSMKGTELLFNPSILNQDDAKYVGGNFNACPCNYRTIAEVNEIPGMRNKLSNLHFNARSYSKEFECIDKSNIGYKGKTYCHAESWLVKGEDVFFKD